MSVWDGFAGSVASGVAGVTSGILSSSASREAAQMSKEENAVNRAFQVDTLKHQHQWEVSDLKKAGLNPILSANGGTGGASGSSTAIPPIQSGVSEAAATAKTVQDIVESMSRASLNDEKKKSEKGTVKNAIGSVVNDIGVQGKKGIEKVKGKLTDMGKVGFGLEKGVYNWVRSLMSPSSAADVTKPQVRDAEPIDSNFNSAYQKRMFNSEPDSMGVN